MALHEEGLMDSSQPVPANNDAMYEIKIKGLLDDHWQQWFEGMTLQVQDDTESTEAFTLIVGPIADQPALHGLLEQIRDLNLPLVSVRILPKPAPGQNAAEQDAEPEGAASSSTPDCSGLPE